MIVVAIGAVLIAAIANHVGDVDRLGRDRDQQQAAEALYESEQRVYALALAARDRCLEAVEYDELNRDQHLANIRAYETLMPLTPPAYQAGIQLIIDKLKEGRLLSSPPRTVKECPPVPVAPVPPDSRESTAP
jgi:hypothetical protein